MNVDSFESLSLQPFSGRVVGIWGFGCSETSFANEASISSTHSQETALLPTFWRISTELGFCANRGLPLRARRSSRERLRFATFWRISTDLGFRRDGVFLKRGLTRTRMFSTLHRGSTRTRMFSSLKRARPRTRMFSIKKRTTPRTRMFSVRAEAETRTRMFR